MQCGIDEIDNQLGELSRIKHLGDLDVGLREASECLPALLHVANLEEQRQLLALANLVAVYLFYQPAQKVLSLSKLELDGLPVVSDKERLHP